MQLYDLFSKPATVCILTRKYQSSIDSSKGLVCVCSLNTEPYCYFAGLEGPNITLDVFREFRSHYKGTLMINGALSPDQGAKYLGDGTADFVACAVLFLSNSNLPALIKAGKELNKGGGNVKVWYGKETKEITAVDTEGYTDWPLVKV